jgi:hypothetical protein
MNNLPTSKNSSFSTTENITKSFSASDFFFNDNDPTDSLQEIQITSLVSFGSLKYNNNSVKVNQIISIENIELLKFYPVPYTTGMNYSSFGFRVSDGVDLSKDIYTMVINVLDKNNPPISANKTITVSKNNPKILVKSDFGFTDTDPTDTLQKITIDRLPSVGSLRLNNSIVRLKQVISVNDILANRLTFNPIVGTYGVGYDSFDFRVGDHVEFSSNGYTITINVINEAPSGTDRTFTINEDIPKIFTVTDFGFNDPNNDSLHSIKITSLPNNGKLTFIDQPIILNQILTENEITLGRVKYTPKENEFGNNYDNFKFKVSDGIIYSTLDNTITFHVTPVNDAPTAQDNTISFDEDTIKVFSLSDFNFTDTDGDPITSILITKIPDKGRLTLNSALVVVHQSISASEINTGKLQFAPEANIFGNNYTNFNFKVSDGTLLSESDYSITINIQSVNDAPVSSDQEVRIIEDTNKIFTLDDFNFTDFENDQFRSISITALPTTGTLKFRGIAVSVNDTITVNDILAKKLIFSPVHNMFGDDYSYFRFKVSDGHAYSDTSYKMTIHVTPVNDAPTAIDSNFSMFEDSIKVFSLADFNYVDSDEISFSSIMITSLPENGTLRFNNAIIQVNRIIQVSDITQGRFTYKPMVHEFGQNYTKFTYKVYDGILFSHLDNQITIHIVPVNDAPTARDITVRMNEDTTKVFQIAEFRYSDLERDSVYSIRITELPRVGNLKINSVAVALNRVILISDIEAGKFTYNALLNAYGNDYAYFRFVVNDGILDSVDDYKLTINVQPVDDIPTAENRTAVIHENSFKIFTIDDFGYHDLDGDPLAYITIVSQPSRGKLKISNHPVSYNQMIHAHDIAAGRLVYTPNPNSSGLKYDNFKFIVSDGKFNSKLSYTMMIDVVTVNLAPVASNQYLTIFENEDFIIPLDKFGYIDPNNNPIQYLTIISLPIYGSLKLNDVAVTVGENILSSDIENDLLVYTPEPNAYGFNYTNFRFKVSDGSLASIATYTMTINIRRIDQEPVADHSSLRLDENSTRILNISNFGYRVTNDQPLRSIIITELPRLRSQLLLDMIPVDVNQEISVSNITDGLLAFVPEPYTHGDDYTTIKYRVSDGLSTSLFDTILTIHVTPVNSPPITGNPAV